MSINYLGAIKFLAKDYLNTSKYLVDPSVQSMLLGSQKMEVVAMSMPTTLYI